MSTPAWGRYAAEAFGGRSADRREQHGMARALGTPSRGAGSTPASRSTPTSSAAISDLELARILANSPEGRFWIGLRPRSRREARLRPAAEVLWKVNFALVRASNWIEWGYTPDPENWPAPATGWRGRLARIVHWPAGVLDEARITLVFWSAGQRRPRR